MLSDALTTLVTLAGEFNFDAEVVSALVDMRKDAHEGADVSRTDEKVADARLVGDEVDALRKDRRERSKASRAGRAPASGRTHGGLGENLFSLFTFGGYTRSLNERYGEPHA